MIMRQDMSFGECVWYITVVKIVINWIILLHGASIIASYVYIQCNELLLGSYIHPSVCIAFSISLLQAG